jgi:hypothetical protein
MMLALAAVLGSSLGSSSDPSDPEAIACGHLRPSSNSGSQDIIGNASPDKLFIFHDADQEIDLVLDTCEQTTLDTVLRLWDSDPKSDSAKVIHTSDDSCGLQSKISTRLSAGTYFATVEGYSTLSGGFTLKAMCSDVVNDHTPQFPDGDSALSVDVPENTPGHVVATVGASDGDLAGHIFSNLEYRLVDDHDGAFAIDPATAKLVVGPAGLNREATASYSLEVVASDGGSPPLSATKSVKVTVVDDNDNDPEIYESPASVEILEDVPSLTAIAEVRARDLDIGANAEIEFAITKGDPNSFFRIDSTLGGVAEIKTARSILQAERYFELTVEARDNGKTLSRSTEVVVSVVVKDSEYGEYTSLKVASCSLKIRTSAGLEVAVPFSQTHNELASQYVGLSPGKTQGEIECVGDPGNGDKGTVLFKGSAEAEAGTSRPTRVFLNLLDQEQFDGWFLESVNVFPVVAQISATMPTPSRVELTVSSQDLNANDRLTFSLDTADEGAELSLTPFGCNEMSQGTVCTATVEKADGSPISEPIDIFVVDVPILSAIRPKSIGMTVYNSNESGLVIANHPQIGALMSSRSEVCYSSAGSKVTAAVSARLRDIDVQLATQHVPSLDYQWSALPLQCENYFKFDGSGHSTTSGVLPSNGEQQKGFHLELDPGTGIDEVMCDITFRVQDDLKHAVKDTISVRVCTAESCLCNAGVEQLGGDVRDFHQSLVPAQMEISGNTISASLRLGDKCYEKVCPGETTCKRASTCDPRTGECVFEPKLGASCDDGDITTRDDQCLASGECGGTQKCEGVVCPVKSACHYPSTCVQETGECEFGNPKPAGGPCDDNDVTTKFDRCDAEGLCKGRQVRIEDPEQNMADFSSIGIENKGEIAQQEDTCCDGDICCSPCGPEGTCPESGTFNRLYYLS